MEKPSEFRALVQGGTAGAVALCVLGTPLDVARHAAQTVISKKRPYPGFREAFKASASPLSGLYRGIGPALCFSVISPAAFLVAYEVQRGGTEVIQAGMFARAVQVIASQPFEYFRTSRQAVALLPEKERVHLVRTPWEVATGDGPRTLWRGLGPTLLRDVGASGLFWCSYLKLSETLLSADEWQDLDPGAAQQRAVSSAAVGAACAAAAALATQPFDVVKTKMQTHQMITSDKAGYKKQKVMRFSKVLRATFRESGWRSLWVGGTARAVLAAASGLLLGPFFEYAQLIANDSQRPLRQRLVLGEDPSRIIVHPRSSKEMFIEVKGARQQD